MLGRWYWKPGGYAGMCGACLRHRGLPSRRYCGVAWECIGGDIYMAAAERLKDACPRLQLRQRAGVRSGCGCAKAFLGGLCAYRGRLGHLGS
jgi:hypothetical protein